MNSNNAVDMAAAIIICSARKAKSLGIREDRWVYPWAGTDDDDLKPERHPLVLVQAT